MGEPGHLTDSGTTSEGDVRTCRYTNLANAKEDSTGKTGALYFVLEEYKEVGSASEKYTTIKKANEGHEGIQTLDDVGDEAYYHSDGTNFHFIMARKGVWVLVMKVNKITGTTSLDAFNTVARRIVAGL